MHQLTTQLFSYVEEGGHSGDLVSFLSQYVTGRKGLFYRELVDAASSKKQYS